MDRDINPDHQTETGSENIKTLAIIIEQQQHRIQLTEKMIKQADSLLEKMDSDMNKGWQLCRQFLEHPNPKQRCQIAASRLMTALHTENQAMLSLMSAYILTRMPEVATVYINGEGEDDQTFFYDQHNQLI